MHKTPADDFRAASQVLCNILKNGTKEWLRDGVRHRDDGPAVEGASGSKEWWRDGQWHREDGPAIERADGGKEWWRDGKRHRDDGPALEWADGTKEWWQNGECLTPDQVSKLEAVLSEKLAREAAVLAQDLSVLPTISIVKRTPKPSPTP